jgi:DNA polymerase (family 10)
MNETNQDIAHLLRSIAVVYTLQGQNRFRIIAYEKAAEVIQYLPYNIKDVWVKGELDKIQGIGATLTQHLDEYFKDPENSYLNKTLHEIPQSVFLLMNIPGVGPKKALKLIKAFDLEDPKTAVEKLQKAAENGRIAELESFGEKSEKEILESIEIFKNNQDKEKRMPYPIAFDVAQDIIEYMKENKHVKHIDVLGSMRRKKSTIGDIDLAIVADDTQVENIIQYFVDYPKKIGIESQGDKKGSIIATNGMGIDLRVTSKDTYGAMLQYFTGSKAHNIKLREYAQKKGLSSNEYGIKNIKDNTIKHFTTEKDFYNYLGLDYIEPEMREGNEEIELAKKHQLPTLINADSLRGDFHIHSNYPIEPSHDLGANSPEEILDRALQKKYLYIGFSEHNPSMSNHTDEQIITILKKRKEHMSKIFLNKKYKDIDCYLGLEVDILPDGNLALPNGAEKYLDYIIVSVHSRFTQPEEETTKRILRALEHPKVKIFGHPTGRLIEKREGIHANWDEIFKSCKTKNIACEINASPYRLDLPDVLVKRAKELGVRFTIDSDTHGIKEMDNLEYGISVARRGWLEKDDVMTTKSQKTFRDWLL